MAYNFIKLSEVELVESPQSVPNVLIEDNGEIKRMSAESLGGGGGGSNTLDYEIISYTNDSGMFTTILKNGAKNEIIEEWRKGTTIRLKQQDNDDGVASFVVSSLMFFNGNLALVTPHFNDPMSNVINIIREE